MTKLVETEIPDWAKWMAQDHDGAWIVFEKKPTANPKSGIWVNGGIFEFCGHRGGQSAEWRTTLHKLEEK